MSTTAVPGFLQGGGEMGEITRAFDWSATSLGMPESWPQSLRTTVGILLHSAFPMFLFWGDDLTCFYNDAFRPSLGQDGKHPSVGKMGKDVWPEIWDFIGPLIQQVMTTGQPVWFENQLVPFFRNGKVEEIYWTFSYSPAYGDDGTISGVFVVCTETTGTVRNLRELSESETRFRTMAESSDILIALSDETGNAVYFNKAWAALTGRPVKDLLSFGWADMVHDDDRQGFLDIYLTAFSAREPWVGEFRMRGSDGGYRWLLANGAVRSAPDGTFSGYISSCIDITGRKTMEAALKTSEQRFRNLIAESVVAIGVLEGPDMIVEIANHALIGLWGKGSDVIGKPILEVMPELKGQPYLQLLKDVYNNNRMYSQEAAKVLLERNGVLETVYRDFSYKPLTDNDGKVTGILVMVIDVTPRVMAQQRLKESELRVRSVVESAPFPIGVYIGREMRIELANQSIIDVWGKGRDVIGKRYADILPELAGQAIFQQLDQVYTSGEPLHVRNQQLDLVVDGRSTSFYFNYSFTPLYDTNGEVYGIMNTAADVTDLNLAKQKVEENAKSIRNTILKAPVAMCILRGAEHKVEIANDRMIEFLGTTAENILKKPIFDGLPEARGQGFEQLLDSVFQTGEALMAHEVPVSLPRKGKIETIYVNYVYEAYREENGAISGIIAVASDVTDQYVARKKIEEVVADRTKELAEANSSLERSNAELAQFAYIASHDLQEPIRKVTTFTEMLSKSLGDVDERSKGYMTKINTSASRMTRLIRDVLAYSQLAKEQDIFTQVDLNTVMDDIESDFELLIEQKGATIERHGLPAISAIPLQMSQLFGNLVSNSLKFIRPDVKPVISLSAVLMTADEVTGHAQLQGAGTYYNITFRDNGIGFEQEHAEQIFNIFQRLHGRSEYEGTGIGLAMCRKIAQNHHGEIYATSNSGNGAIINVILPA